MVDYENGFDIFALNLCATPNALVWVMVRLE
jgi:hypothetical protein